MIPFLVCVLAIGLFVRQFTEKNRTKWSNRRAVFVYHAAPVAHYVLADIRAVRRHLSARFRRIDVDWDEVEF